MEAKTARNNVQLHGSVWLTVGNENFGGFGRILLLTKIAEYGSITQAARSMKMSYKAAWDAVDMMNNLAGEPLVERAVGGKGGGGTKLTERGRQLIENFELITREHQRFIQQLNTQVTGIADDLLLIARVGMKTSARNQFLGKVTAIQDGAVNDRIELGIAGGHTIIATVTSESTHDLNLKIGSEAFALIKASSVLIINENNEAHFSASNRLTGVVSRIQPGAVNSEVILDLPGGAAITANITNESCEQLNLEAGKSATALFKASSVILGVPL